MTPLIAFNEDQNFPLVLDSPHSGINYPKDFKYQVEKLSLLKMTDSFVDELFAECVTRDIGYLTAQFPRSYIDLNRQATDLDEKLITGIPANALPTDKSFRGMGLIWRLNKNGEDIYKDLLSMDEVRTRIKDYYVPYHLKLDEMLNKRHKAHDVVWHLNCHSMPSSGGKTDKDTGNKRADFVISDDMGMTSSTEFVDVIFGSLINMGYNVAVNDPYKGDALIKKYSNPLLNRNSVQLEINRALYMNEDTVTKNDNFEDFKKDMQKLVEDMHDFVKTSIA